MEEPQAQDWQAPPPPPPSEVKEAPKMSELGTIAGIFFEPGATFEDLRRKPRFITAVLITTFLFTAYSFALAYKVGDAGMRRYLSEKIESSSFTANMSAEDKAKNVEAQMKFGTIGRFIVPIFVIITLFVGGLLYWLGGKAFGGSGGYLQNVSVFVYSGLPPLIVSLAASLIVMIFKDPDTIDIAASQRGLIMASPAVLMDGHAMPVITTLVGTIDLFFIWGWILAAIGLRIANKISVGSAWAITIIFALVGVAFRIFGAYTGGAAQ